MYTFKTVKYLTILAASAALLQGCIKNDIPYPRIQPNFTEFEVVDALQSATIDTTNRTITVYLSEEANPYEVQLNSFTLTPSDAVWPDSLLWLNGGVDLTTPAELTVALYQEYAWRVTAVQEIERYFTFEGQIGSASIEPEAHRVVAYINSRADIHEVKVTSIKLGAEGSTMTPDLAGKSVDFSEPVKVEVNSWGHTDEWSIYVIETDAEVTTESVDAWTKVAWLHGSAQAGRDNGFEYRRADESEWTRMPADWVTHDGGSFTGRLIHLQPLTQYVARAYSGTATGEEIAFTTGATATIPNGDFENWWLDGKIWNPWAQDGTPWWGTGNRGATTLGDSNTTPSTDTPSGRGRAARLETRFVGIGALGKLAAGNIFAGVYVRTDGTNGVLSFGREFSIRPTKVKGWMKYNCANISSTTAGFHDLKGRPDTCIVWCALIDSENPFEIRTNPNNRQLFDSNGPEVIAYGDVQYGETVGEYRQFEITLDYRSTSRVPRYLLLVASASKYGDYFTGGNGSVLYIDDLSLDFDY